jgi:peptidyl-prolyl cis-trans isomerase SurA
MIRIGKWGIGGHAAEAVEGEAEGMSHIPAPVGSQTPVRGSAWMRTAVTAALVALGALALSPIGSTPARAQQVVVLVDGQPITALDIEQRTKFIMMSAHRTPTRQEVIDGLIDEILEIREAKHYSVDLSDSDVDDQFNNVASSMNIDNQKLTQILVAGGASAQTLKQKLRAQMSWASLVRGRYRATLEIPDSDVEAQMHLHDNGGAAQTGYEYVLRPVLLVVPRGSPDSVFDGRKKEAEALRARFSDCTSGIPFARALREVAVRDPVNKTSADFSEEIRGILDKTDVGHLTPPDQTGEGIQMFAVCSKKESKSDAPGMQKVRDQIFEKKFGAQAKRYLASLRRQAMIEYKQPVEDTPGTNGRTGAKR